MARSEAAPITMATSSRQSFPEPHHDAWRQVGNVYLWRFTENLRNYPGWHLATDEAGLVSLVDLLRRLRVSEESGASRALQLSQPTSEVLAVPNNRRSPVVAPERARIRRHMDDEHWAFDEANDSVSLSVGRRHLDGLLSWLAHPESAFDTTYGDSPELWYWGVVPGATSGEGRRGTR